MKKTICLILAVCTVAGTLTLTACGKDETRANEYDIVASYDSETKTLTGTVNFTYYNDTDNEISDLKFNLYGNAFRENAKFSPVSQSYTDSAYYSGKSYGSMTVDSVENCAGWNIAGEDENILSVTLLNPVYPEDKANISISYKLSLANVNHRTGVTENTVNLGNFYPVLCAYTSEGFVECPYYSCGDPFLSECSNYKVTLDYPAEYTAATSGKAGKESTSGERKKCTYTLDNARDFACVLSDKFNVETRIVGKTEVKYYYYKDENPKTSLNAASESVEYFNETFGGYVYPTLSVVQTGFCYGGMEYPALTMISDKLDAEGNIYTIVHENAHQWWYAMVGSDQLNCAWQDEGLAEYSSLMFFETHPDYNFTRLGIVGSATKAYRAYFSVYNQIFGETNTCMNRHVSEFSSDYEYANIAYNKGLILFDMLRQSIGDEKFTSALKDYFNDNIYTIAPYENLYASFLKYGDLEGFFASFIDGKIVI